jgi:hypothetical protein
MTTTHAYPRPHETTTPCCGRLLIQLPINDKVSTSQERVTCGKEGK